MDGSSKHFVNAIEKSGLKICDAPIKIIKILNKISVKDGNKFAYIEPSKTTLEIDFEIKDGAQRCQNFRASARACR